MYLSMLISTWYKIIHIVNTYKCDVIFLYICLLWSEFSLTVWVSYCGLSSQTTCRSFSSLSFGRVCEISEKMISIKFSCSLLWKRDIRIDLYSRVKRRPRAAPLRRNTSREAKKFNKIGCSRVISHPGNSALTSIHFLLIFFYLLDGSRQKDETARCLCRKVTIALDYRFSTYPSLKISFGNFLKGKLIWRFSGNLIKSFSLLFLVVLL